MNVYDFFTDSAKRAHEASIPNEEISSLVDKMNGYEEKAKKLTLEDDGSVSITNLGVTDKANVKTLVVQDSLHLSGGRLYLASRHPEETNAPYLNLEVTKKSVIIKPEEWDDMEINLGTEEAPIIATCYMATVENETIKEKNILSLDTLKAEDLDPKILTYMSYVKISATFDQLVFTLLPAEDEYQTGKTYTVDRPTGNIAFTISYID